MNNIKDLAKTFSEHLAEKVQNVVSCESQLTAQLYSFSDEGDKLQYLKHLKNNIESLYVKHLQICFTPLTCEENKSYETTLGVIRQSYLSLIDKQNKFDMYERPAISFFTREKYLDGFSLIMEKVKDAKESIILIDHYVDDKTLSFFSNKPKHVALTIKTKAKSMNENLEKAWKLYNKEIGNLDIEITSAFADRLIIIDKTSFFHINQSIRDAAVINPLYIIEINDLEIKDLINKKLQH